MITITTTGSIANPRTITLDEPLTESSGRVRITVESATVESTAGERLSVFLKEMRERRIAEGRRPKTPEEIQAIIDEMIEARGD